MKFHVDFNQDNQRGKGTKLNLIHTMKLML